MINFLIVLLMIRLSFNMPVVGFKTGKKPPGRGVQGGARTGFFESQSVQGGARTGFFESQAVQGGATT